MIAPPMPVFQGYGTHAFAASGVSPGMTTNGPVATNEGDFSRADSSPVVTQAPRITNVPYSRGMGDGLQQLP